MSSDMYNDEHYATTFTLPPGFYRSVYDGPTFQLPPEPFPGHVTTTTYKLPPKPFNFIELAANIMLAVCIIIFLITCFLVFNRWRVHHTRHRYFRRHMRLLREQILLYHERLRAAGVRRVFVGGLDQGAVLNWLPVFVYDSSPDPEADPPECAVCLSEFEDGETCRVLPKCKHSFHVECIDVWFQRNSTCPLCRRVVKIELCDDVAVVVVNVCGGPEEVNEVETGTGSGSNEGEEEADGYKYNGAESA